MLLVIYVRCHSGSFLNNDYATHQFYTLVPARFLVKIPSFMSFDEAATVPFCLNAIVAGLYGSTSKHGLGLTPPWLPEGKGKYSAYSIVILGGSSTIGKYTVQLARESGFGIIITTSSTPHHALLRSLGATHVLDRTRDMLPTIGQILAKSPGGLPGQADVVVDAISLTECQRLAVQLTKPAGAIIYTLPPPEDLPLGHRKMVTPCALLQPQPELGEALARVLPGWLKSGTIKVDSLSLLLSA